MIFNLIIYKRDGSKGYEFKANNLTKTTYRRGSAGTMSCTIYDVNDGDINNGDYVECMLDGVKFFKGTVFKNKLNEKHECDITAYNSLRYLKTNQSYSFVGQSLDEIIRKVCSDFLIEVGELEAVPYKIPELTKEDCSLFDIIENAIMLTQNNTGLTYIMYDDFGKVCLKQAKNRTLSKNYVIGYKSLAEGYDYTKDIDSETYNQIRMVRPNKETGKGDVYIAKDSNNIQKWGLLQLYKKIDEEVNEAEIQQSLATHLQYYNRELETIDIPTTEGIPEMDAGMMIAIEIPELKRFANAQYVIVDQVEHNISGNSHTMKLKVNVLTI